MLSPEVLKAIQAMTSKDQLQEVYDAAGDQWKRLSTLECLHFNVGDPVKFFARRQNWSGFVERINRTSVTVKCCDAIWKVAPNHLTKIKAEDVKKGEKIVITKVTRIGREA